MQIEEVSIEDVYPWEDEYGNAVLSRDYTAKANQEYVQELADSMRSKGIPDEPVTLARDGQIYRIIAGNSRVMAMRELGTKRFPAVVLDSAEAKAAVETTVRTNTKKKYEPGEESRFVQQLMLFGDDAYVSEVSGIDAETVSKARRARRAVDDAAEDMTLDRLVAISEFVEDEEAVEQLSNCHEHEWRGIVSRLRMRRRMRKTDAEIAAALAQAGIVLLDKEPEDAVHVCTAYDAEAVPEVSGEPGDPTCAVRFEGYNYPYYRLYRIKSADEREEDASAEEDKALRREQQAHDELVADRMRERRTEWVVERLAEGVQRLPHVSEKAVEWMREGEYQEAYRWLDEHGIAATASTADVVTYLVDSLDAHRFGMWSYGWSGEGKRQSGSHSLAWHDAYEALLADGYEMDEEEQKQFEDSAEVE